MLKRPLLPDKHGVPKYKYNIQRIGVELEGRWDCRCTANDDYVKALHEWKKVIHKMQLAARYGERDPIYPEAPTIAKCACIPEGWEKDESVRHFDRADDPTVKRSQAGEVKTPENGLIRPDLWVWMRANYPHAINRTCGMHVHMSFRHLLDYQRLMVREYHDHMVQGIYEWAVRENLPSEHLLWKRILGLNDFCQDVFRPEQQVNLPEKHANGYFCRYAVLNYHFKTHKTIELRLLPMFEDVEQGIRAVRRTLNLTEEFLAGQRKHREMAFIGGVSKADVEMTPLEHHVVTSAIQNISLADDYIESDVEDFYKINDRRDGERIVYADSICVDDYCDEYAQEHVVLYDFAQIKTTANVKVELMAEGELTYVNRNNLNALRSIQKTFPDELTAFDKRKLATARNPFAYEPNQDQLKKRLVKKQQQQVVVHTTDYIEKILTTPYVGNFDYIVR